MLMLWNYREWMWSGCGVVLEGLWSGCGVDVEGK